MLKNLLPIVSLLILFTSWQDGTGRQAIEVYPEVSFLNRYVNFSQVEIGAQVPDRLMNGQVGPV